MLRVATRRLVAACALASVFAHALRAQAQAASDAPPPVHWPAILPALGAHVSDPNDGRAWAITTRVDGTAMAVLATAPGGTAAVVLRRARRGRANCTAQLSQLLHADDLSTYRAAMPAVFRGAPWDAGVYQQNSATHDGEFGCLVAGSDVWIATAVAQPRAGISLTDTFAIAQQLARAIGTPTTRRAFPLFLEVSGLELDDPHDDATWLFLGRAVGFPIASDALSSGASDTGGVTLTVGRRAGTCGGAWAQLRQSLASDAALVDRPGYVPTEFGARVRRLVTNDHTREIFCLGTTEGAVLVTVAFRTDDGDAMTRAAPMLRAIVASADSIALGSSAPPGASDAPSSSPRP